MPINEKKDVESPGPSNELKPDKILRQGVNVWNEWRKEHRGVRPDLSRADLSKADLPGVDLIEAYLSRADLSGTDLPGADLMEADLFEANLSRANLHRADLSFAYLTGADLTGANLSKAFLIGANLTGADLTGADLTGADLTQATLVDTTVGGAKFTGCHVYGISVWNLIEVPEKQNDLIITRDFEPHNEPTIAVDNLEVAQFIYTLVNHKKLRDIIQEVTSKVVLILGRFTKERLGVLKALQEELRHYTDKDGKARYIPVMFDFDPDNASQDFLETVQTIASLSRFIIADITSPTGVLVELASIIPHCKVPVKFVMDTSTGDRPVSMLQPFTLYPWLVKPVSGYRSTQELCVSVSELIGPIEQMVNQVRKAKAEEVLEVENLGGCNG